MVEKMSQRHISLWYLTFLGRLSKSKNYCVVRVYYLKDQRGLQSEVSMAARYSNGLLVL